MTAGVGRFVGVIVAISAGMFVSAFSFAALADRASANERVPLATVNGRTIHVDEVEGALAFRIFQHELDIYSLLAEEAERRIEAEVLADAARARGISVEALLLDLEGGGRGGDKDGPGSQSNPVSAQEIDRYLAEHPAAPHADPAAVRERVAQYLGERRRLERRIAGLAALREAAGARILLVAPEPPRTEFAIGKFPTRGPAAAKVAIVHFASLGSRAGARSAANLSRLFAALPGEIRWSHVHLLSDHDEAGLHAARLAVAAAAAGRFWPFHDAVVAARLDAHAKLDAARLDALAAQAGLTAGAIRRAAQDGASLAAVKSDIDCANAAGIPREPGLFVNGLFVSGLLPYEELEKIVRQEALSSRSNPRPGLR